MQDKIGDIDLRTPEGKIKVATLSVGYQHLIDQAVERGDLASLTVFTGKAQELCDSVWKDFKRRTGLGKEIA